MFSSGGSHASFVCVCFGTFCVIDFVLIYIFILRDSELGESEREREHEVG